MTDILVSLIEESAGIPSGVLEIMLDQFTPKNAVCPQLTCIGEAPL